ncbi:MAG: AI-2E family transporter [Verrucomicrobia bacterium]|nr:AI-2E family transporter [Verrucomicrobiota bacterium]
MNPEANDPGKSSFGALPSSAVAAWILSAVALFLVLKLHLLSALIAGLLTHELVRSLAPLVEKRLTSKGARLLALAALSVVTVTLLILLTLGTFAFFRSDTGNRQALLSKTDHILTEAQTKLPPWIVESLPSNVDALKSIAREWIDEHSNEIQHAGKEAMHFFIRGLVGMVIGALISVHEETSEITTHPFAAALNLRISRFAYAFRRIMFAQAKISALNTVFTGIFLAAILPACGVHLPLTKTLVAITFLTGLLPVIGNLISNTMIFIVGLSISISVAIAVLIFLVVIHKLEYFLNARIVGTRIRAHAWELLLAMLVMEVAFGMAGLIAAPIYYAYIKNELSDAGLI